MAKPLIIVTNDDGVTSKGIRILTELMASIGEVTVVAPDSPQSGMGHAITLDNPLRLYETDRYGKSKVYKCSGTPADCVKIAKSHVLGKKNADLIVSGINHGRNTSISVLYSGTMSAAIEGAIEGTPSIGYSLCEFAEDADFSHTYDYVLKIAEEVVKNKLPKGVALNVNFPKKQEEAIKGIKICRQATTKWDEHFDKRADPMGHHYFWMARGYEIHDKGEDHDEWAIANNYVSVVPCQFDLTAHHAISILNDEWELS
ncbi:MAG: 5'/3'-nucleotidase SurE [Cytophagales bacterium]|nr:5'/3'-nucleotidase SurE [Cytophagales bacterium]